MLEQAALLVVDVQNDFCQGGALAVPGADEIIPVLNNYLRLFVKNGLPILATRDWHPPQSRHFQRYGGNWPLHCVADTFGARFHPRLALPAQTIIISKGVGESQDGYSGFEGTDAQGRPLEVVLKGLEVRELYVGGLATDYCVKETALDALRRGWGVNLLVDAIRAVDLKPDDGAKAIREILALGGKEMTFEKLNSQQGRETK